jgi:hypothetical protein
LCPTLNPPAPGTRPSVRRRSGRTSGRPYCNLAHRSSNDREAHDTKMCAFLTATRGEEPKIGSTSDGYGLFNRYGLFYNGINRASSCKLACACWACCGHLWSQLEMFHSNHSPKDWSVVVHQTSQLECGFLDVRPLVLMKFSVIILFHRQSSKTSLTVVTIQYANLC